MPSIRRSALRVTVALLLVAMAIPLETLRLDPAAVAAAVQAPAEHAADAAPPAAPGDVKVAGYTIRVRGHVVNGEFRIGTFWKDY